MKNTNNSVKKHQTYLVLLFAVLFSGSIQAAVNNYIGAYGFLGEWSLRPSQSDYKMSYGVAGGAGFLYELQAGAKYKPTRFLLDIGVGAWGGMTSYNQSNNTLTRIGDDTDKPLYYLNDLQGDPFDFYYEIKNRHDQYRDIAVQVPIMVGVQYRKFYMLVGAKINSHLYTKTYTTATVTTFGRYENIPDLCNMPDYQFFNDKPLQRSTKTNLKLDVAASLEIGGRLGAVHDAVGYDVPKRKIECRLAGFIDYGLTDIHKEINPVSVETPDMYDTRMFVNEQPNPDYVYQKTTMIDKLGVNDIMSTNGFASAVNSMMIGLKFTILFQLPEPGQCVLCNESYRSTASPRRGRLKYEE